MSLKFALMVGLYALTEISAQDGCTQGKSYWCLNLSNAKDCNAVEECISVWAEKPETKNGDTMCKFCEQVLSKVEGLAEGKEVEKLSGELENKCNLIELESERKRCNNIADGLDPELVEALLNIPNPQKICSVIDICPRSKDDGKDEKVDIRSFGDFGEPEELHRFNNGNKPIDKRIFGTIFKILNWAPGGIVSSSNVEEDQARPVQKRIFKKLWRWGKKAVNLYGKVKNGLNMIQNGGNRYGPNMYGQPHYGYNPYVNNQFGHPQFGHPQFGNPQFG